MTKEANIMRGVLIFHLT